MGIFTLQVTDEYGSMWSTGGGHSYILTEVLVSIFGKLTLHPLKPVIATCAIQVLAVGFPRQISSSATFDLRSRRVETHLRTEQKESFRSFPGTLSSGSADEETIGEEHERGALDP